MCVASPQEKLRYTTSAFADFSLGHTKSKCSCSGPLLPVLGNRFTAWILSTGHRGLICIPNAHHSAIVCAVLCSPVLTCKRLEDKARFAGNSFLLPPHTSCEPCTECANKYLSKRLNECKLSRWKFMEVRAWLCLIYSAPGIASHANHHLILMFDGHGTDNETLQGMAEEKALWCWYLLL